MVRVAMLNCDVPVPQVHARYPTYGSVFGELLQAAAHRVSPKSEIQFEDFDVILGQYPSSLADSFDAILLTGSASSAYDKADWISRLEAYVLDVYQNHPQIKIFGSCFGHQLLAQSLLSPGKSTVVEKDPNGWEIGVKRINLNEQFLKHFRMKEAEGNARPLTPDQDLTDSSSQSSSLRLQFVHADHVRLSLTQALPESWMTIGSTKHCANQGMYLPGRVLTYQGHFEFDRFINSETMKVFGAAWKPEDLQSALDAIDADDDAEAAADIVAKFLLGRDSPRPHSTVANGLLTPPGETN